MPALLRFEPHRERLHQCHLVSFVSSAAPYNTPREETAHAETRVFRRAFLPVRGAALSAPVPAALSAAAPDAAPSHDAAGSWRRRRRCRPCVTRYRRSSLSSLSPFSTGPLFELFHDSHIRYIGDRRPKHARSSASFVSLPPSPPSPSHPPHSLSLSSFFSGSSSSPPPLPPPPPPPPTAPAPSPGSSLPFEIGHNEERFRSAGMNPVAKGCSGHPKQSCIPVNRAGTRNVPQVPGLDTTIYYGTI